MHAIHRVSMLLLVFGALLVAPSTNAIADEGDAPDDVRTRMHVVVKKGTVDGPVETFTLKDGKWIRVGEPVEVEREIVIRRGPPTVTTPGQETERRDPMSTVMRWLLTEGMAEERAADPLTMWFEGGDDVPLAGLRDALRQDGWTAQSLQAWFLRHLLGGMAAMTTPAHAPRGMRGPGRARWFEIGRGHAGCDCHQRRRCRCDAPCGPRYQHGCRCCDGCGCCRGRGACYAGHGGGNGVDHHARPHRGGCDCNARAPRPRGPARRQAFLLWNDGTGWKQRKLQEQGRVHEAPGDMTFEGAPTDEAPELARILRGLMDRAETESDAARIVVEGVEELLPPELLEHVPPGVLEGVLKELEGLGLGGLTPEKPGCEDCPKKGSCQGEGCDPDTDGKPAGCGGTCGGSAK